MAGGQVTETAPTQSAYTQVSQVENMSPEETTQVNYAVKYVKAKKIMLVLIGLSTVLVVSGLVLTIVGALIGEVLDIALGGALLVLGFMLLCPAFVCYFRMKKIAYDSQMDGGRTSISSRPSNYSVHSSSSVQMTSVAAIDSTPPAESRTLPNDSQDNDNEIKNTVVVNESEEKR